MRPFMLAVVLFAVLPVAAQEAEPEPIEVEVVEEPAEVEEAEPSRIVAAAWCQVSGRRDQAPDPAAEEPGADVDQQAAEEQQGVGCDGGVGVSLLYRDFRQGRLSLVGVVGVRSLGTGIAWTFGRQNGHPLSVALGVVMPYTGEGVFADEAALAVGATISVFGRQ